MEQLAKKIDDLTRSRDELETQLGFLEDYLKNKWFELLCRVEEEAFANCCAYMWRRRSVVYEAKKVLGYKTDMENIEKERKEKEEREKKERLTRTNSKP